MIETLRRLVARHPVGAAVTLALVVRAAWVLTLPERLTWEDEEAFATIARHLVAGDGYVGASFRSNPMQAGYLAAFFALLGERLLWPRLGQAVLGALSCLLVGRIAARLCHPAAGWIAALAMALYPPLVFMTGFFYVDTLVIFVCAVAVVLAIEVAERRGAIGWAMACGVTLGLTALTRANFVVALPAVVASWLLQSRGWRGRALLAGGAATLAAVLTIAPWTLRNWHAYGRFIPVSTGFATKLWEGNNPMSRGDADDRDLYWGNDVWAARLAELPPERQAAVRAQYDDIAERVRVRQRALGDTYLALDEILLPVALEHIRANPGSTVALFARKIGTLFSPFTTTHLENEYTSRAYRIVASVTFYPLLVLALLGACMWPWARRSLVLPCLLIAAVSATYGLLNACTRFRLPLDPYLIVLAALPLAHAWAWWQARSATVVAVPSEA